MCAFAFPQRLARAGLRSLVIAPLLVESQVFGVLVAARRAAECFQQRRMRIPARSSASTWRWPRTRRSCTARCSRPTTTCARRSNVMQQERLRALGQMASGIAHDINNAISPVVAVHRVAAGARDRT